jgi:3-oxoacyl-[acyl-carrier-protein] synthase III
VPLVLAAAERDRLLSPGDVAVLVAAGNGKTFGATVLRWGRGPS